MVVGQPAQQRNNDATSGIGSSSSADRVWDSGGATYSSWPDGDKQSPRGMPTIQGGCGYLVVVEEDVGVASGVRLVGLSSNITDSPWWSCACSSGSAADLLGKDLTDAFRPEIAENVRSLLERHKKSPHDAHSLPQKKTYGELTSPDDQGSDQVLTCSMAPGTMGVYLLEVEPVRGGRHRLGPETPAPDPGPLHVAHMMRSIPVGATPELCTTVLCDALAEVMPAYDRVMVHRFAADSSVEVIHETTPPGSTVGSSCLGLRFPAAGDVPPAAAREPLLKRVGACFIADTSAQAVPVVVSNRCRGEGDAQELDISMTALGASAERRRLHLRNAGVTADMVVAIAAQDELWGLFTFHSYTGAVVPTMAERVAAEVAAALSAKAIAHYELDRTVRLSRALAHVSSYTRVQDFLRAEHPTLLGLLELDSIVMWEPQKSVLVFGGDGEVTLSPAECESLVAAGDDHRHISIRSTEAKGVAFFTVRSFLLAFLRGRVSRRTAAVSSTASRPHPPLFGDDGRGAAGPTAAAGWENGWSQRTVTLLGIMRHGLSSQLYAEALFADNSEMLAHVSHELRTPFHGVMSSLAALVQERLSLGAEEKDSILRSAMDAGDSM